MELRPLVRRSHTYLTRCGRFEIGRTGLGPDRWYVRPYRPPYIVQFWLKEVGLDRQYFRSLSDAVAAVEAHLTIEPMDVPLPVHRWRRQPDGSWTTACGAWQTEKTDDPGTTRPWRIARADTATTFYKHTFRDVQIAVDNADRADGIESCCHGPGARPS